MNIKLLLRKCISETFRGEGITIDEFEHACEWLDNNVGEETEDKGFTDYEAKLYQRLGDDMQRDYEATGDIVDRDYILGMEDFKQLKEIHGAYEMSYMMFNGDFGKYRLVFDES